MSEKTTGINDDSGGKEPAEKIAPSQVSEGSGAESSSPDEDVDAAETTEEMAETSVVNDAETEELTTTAASPLVAEESDGIILSVDDGEPAAAEAQEHHDHEAEIFAGFSLESNGIRFRGPKSGKTVRGGLLLFVFLLCAHDVSAFSNIYITILFSCSI